MVSSRLLNWYYHTLNPEVGEALAEVKKANVAVLPIPILDMADPTLRQKHDRLVELVGRMLGLHGQLAKAKVPADRAGLQDQIAATDRQIDRLVYDLYGLTEDEIRIVEGATTAAPPADESAAS